MWHSIILEQHVAVVHGSIAVLGTNVTDDNSFQRSVSLSCL